MLEILRPNPAPGRLRQAVFDFDGTLSLLRAGWQTVMADMMVEALAAAPGAEAEVELRARTDEPVFGMAGQPTLAQMTWLAEQVARRGGTPLTAEAYKAGYLARLAERVTHRAEVEAGRRPAEHFRVPGALTFVAALHARGVTCHIASGTDETAVREEAELLGFMPYVTELRGARADGSDAKQALIEWLTTAQRLEAGKLAAIGDGRAEMACARAVNGLAIGVASNEAGQPGVDERKRTLLIAAGADVIIPDFNQPQALLTYLWPSE